MSFFKQPTKTIIKCPKCKFLNEEDSLFCGSCGFAVSDLQKFQLAVQQQLETNAQLARQNIQLQSEIRQLETQKNHLQKQVTALDEEANIQSFGFYKPRYSFSNSQMYQMKIDEIKNAQKDMIRYKTAAQCFTKWTVNNSVVEGRKSTNQTLKMMLRGFNGESDAAIAKAKYNNVEVMEKRILKSFETINSLATVSQCFINQEYFNLKLSELYLVHEYEEKLYEEKEEQRRIREQIREEEKAQRDFEKAKLEAEKEERRYLLALDKAREEVKNLEGIKQEKMMEQIALLEQKLSEAQFNKERAISMAQMTRSGVVYIISNLGSFGENVFKIGMTRRLDPMDRVHELGAASVPFKFDVHAFIYSDDAPTLEHKLHKRFQYCRINQVNNRKEFFQVPLNEIIVAVKELHGEIEFKASPEAKEFRTSNAFIKTQ
jgi:Domain of unknown function (DUF4041)/Meiotically up-regulated gene 113